MTDSDEPSAWGAHFDGIAHKSDSSMIGTHMECGADLNPHHADVYPNLDAAIEAGFDVCSACWGDAR